MHTHLARAAKSCARPISSAANNPPRAGHRRLPGWGYRFVARCLLVSLGVLPGVALADSPEAKGLAIAREADRRDLGFADSQVALKMLLKNAHGQTSVRSLLIRTKEVADENEGDKTIIVFDQPRDIKGTALLTHTHIARADDQWLFLPALKRIKRISSANKSGPFMGSEFAYEDLASQEVAKYTYRYLRDEACGDRVCFVVERYPVDKHSGYTRQIAWIDQDEYRLQKSTFYDRKNALFKTLRLSKYRQYLDKHWRALQLDMENHQTRKSTQLVFSDYRFRTGLTDRDFSRTALKRAR
jgi:outer membrane lipoprotein-sorting protein